MKILFEEKILDEAKDWFDKKQKLVLATVVETWNSSPRAVGSKMIVNENGNFSGSVSGGCIETFIVRECLELLKKNEISKRFKFKISNKNAWEVGLACGGEITIFLEKIIQ